MQIQERDFEELVGLPRFVFFTLTSHWCAHLSKNKLGAPRALTPEEQVLLFFTRLRHYPTHCLAAHIFHITKQTSSTYIPELTDFFYHYFIPFINVGTVDSRLNDSFPHYHHKITFILDGTEQPIHATQHIFKEGQYYSQKKQQHSVTILIVISPTGHILYLSPCLYGSVNDDELLFRYADQWYHGNFDKDREAGMGDGGFSGARDHGIEIYTPVRDHTSPLYKAHSKKRIRVENRIADFKDFPILRLPIREKILGNPHILEEHSKNWIIVAGVLNAKMDRWETIMYL